MKNIFKWIAAFFTVESIAYFWHSFKLTRVVNGIKAGTYFKDGDGMGIYFMGTQINDRVPWNEIYLYRDSFLRKGVIVFLIAVVFYILYRKMKKVAILN